MPPWDLVAFMSSAARSGLVAVIPAAGERVLPVVSTNYLQMRNGCRVAWMTMVTAAIANAREYRLKGSLQAHYCHSSTHLRDQTGAVGSKSIAFTGYQLRAGELLGCDVDNNNTAQYEAVLAALDYGGNGFSFDADVPMPPYARWVLLTGAQTLVAGTWTEATLSAGNDTFAVGELYHIIAMAAHSANAYAARLSFKGSSPSVGFRPGVPAGDSSAGEASILAQPMYGDFGAFYGDQLPNAEFLASVADTAEYVLLLVVPSSPAG